MHFVSVASGVKKYCPYENLVVSQTKYALISIIGGLHQKRFGFDTVTRVAKHIQQYKKNYIDKHNAVLYIDSGGYSYIVGDLHPIDSAKLCDVYSYYLREQRDVYDRIFSLDLPISLKYFDYNTKEHIYKYNKLSLQHARDILEKYPEIRDKFYFVWHFKIKSQYEIWKRIVNELDLNSIVKNRAIGGMVGVRGITSIKFSPFIALTYKLFNDYLNSKLDNYPFKIHLLGVYNRSDRFTIAILEALLNHYLSIHNIDQSCEITYDSISYMREAHKDSRNLSYIHFDNNDITFYENQFQIPSHILEQIYGGDLDLVKEELNRIKNNETLSNIATFTPITISNHLCIDKFFQFLITKYSILDIYISSQNYNTLKNRINPILLTLSKKYPYLFTNSFIRLATESIKYVYVFHKWFTLDRSESSLETLISKFIDNIGFPADLA